MEATASPPAGRRCGTGSSQYRALEIRKLWTSFMPKLKDHGAPLFVLAAAGVGGPHSRARRQTCTGQTGLWGSGRAPQSIITPMPARCILSTKAIRSLGGAVAAGGREVAAHLVAPAAVVGVLHDGQQLHMGIAHLGDVGDQQIGQLGVVVGDVLVFVLRVLLHLQLPACIS